MIKHIMVAYDGSEGSKKALEYAMDLLDRSSGQKFTVAHVYHEYKTEIPSNEDKLLNMEAMATKRVDGLYAAHMPLAQDERITQTQEVVHNSADQAISEARFALETRGVHGEFEILDGSPADSISEFADREQVDLIVMGNSGHSGLKKFFIGSVSEKVTKHAHCPVLIVK
ncbi:universal stress protein [Falsibacillus albus]|nr:universal stress protein [Falsibacillus albus]